MSAGSAGRQAELRAGLADAVCRPAGRMGGGDRGGRGPRREKAGSAAGRPAPEWTPPAPWAVGSEPVAPGMEPAGRCRDGAAQALLAAQWGPFPPTPLGAVCAVCF